MTSSRILMLILITAVCMASAGVGAADEVDVTFEGRFGGATYAVAVSGNYACIGQGQDLVVLDVSSPASPVEVGRVMTSGVVNDIAVSGDYAYVADLDNGLVIVDISSKSAPVLAGSYDTAGQAEGVAVSGDYAYVADDRNGLVIVDVSSKSVPVLAGSYDTAGQAMGVAVLGDYAYVADLDNGLVIVDISSKSVPVLAGSYNTAGFAWDVAVSGDYAYVADRSNGLVIVDISSKSVSVLAGSYDTAGQAMGVAVSGDYAYVGDDRNGLVIVDVSSKSVPVLAGSYDTTGYAGGVAVSGDYAYVADRYNGLVIVDVSSKSAPVLAGNYDTDTAGYAGGVAVSGDYAYVADRYNGLVIVDVSSKSAPVLAGNYDTDTAGYTVGVAVSGDYAYVADGYNGLVIVDVSSKSAPVLAGSYDTAGYAVGVAVSGDYAYVADDRNGLVIVDVSSKSAPVLAGSYDTAGQAVGVAVLGDYAYVADLDNGLVIVDISNKSAPVLAGSYDTVGQAVGVAVLGDYAYVADRYNDLVIVDVSSKSAPVFAGSYDTLGWAVGVAVSGDYAYVADQYNGLVIVDVSSKSAPVFAGSYDTAGYAWDVAVSGDYAYVADRSNGLIILRTDASGTGPQNNSLVQVDGQPEVYWLQNGRLYCVTDWDVINDMSGVPGWSSVNTLPVSEFNPADYPQGPRFITTGVESDGLLIREQGHLEVYLIQGGVKQQFTSPEALLWNGYSFDDVIDVAPVIIGMFSSGSDISITQAIIDKYHALGGAATFGPSAGTGEQIGYPDNAGVICTYVNFQNGAIEYFTNGDQAGNAYSILNPFFDKWASMGYAKSVLGYPISDMSDTQTSSLGTPFKYQNFINGTERGALEYNLNSGQVYEIHGAIYATWSAMGYANSVLGLVTSDEREAVPSFKGTTGRVSDFENGHLHWHSSGDHYMVTYMTYDDLDELYVSIGGTASWLGFPVMHQEDRGGYGYCEFEGGYIEWDAASGEYIAKSFGITDGLVAEWHFDEGSSNILTDSSGNGNDGTIYGATWTTDGKFGTALQFDGNDYIVIPDSPELSGGAGKNMTVEFWFNTNKQGGYIISKIKDVSYKDWSALIGGFGPGMNFWYENRGYDRRFYSGSIIEEGVWHHGAFTFQRSIYGNNAVLKMYLDGNELPLTPFYQDGVPSNQLYDIPDTSAPVNIGYSGSYYNCCFFNGKIDEIKIFDRVLSNDEIKAEYERGGTTNPQVQINSPVNKIYPDGSEITFEGVVTGGVPPYNFMWIIDDGRIVEPIHTISNNVDSWTIPNMKQGNHNVKLVINDKNGLIAETETISFSVKLRIAYVPIEFSGGSKLTTNSNLVAYADKVSEYFEQQSYGEEFMDYEFIGPNPLIMSQSLQFYKNEAQQQNKFFENYLRDLVFNEIATKHYPLLRDDFNTRVIITPEKSIIASSYPNHHWAIVNDEGIYEGTVTEGSSYGMWAHEIGHGEFGFSDIGKSEPYWGNIYYWGLMGNGWTMNPPAPITGFVKIKGETGWLNYKEVYKGVEETVLFLDDSKISDKGLLKYESAINPNVNYYIFEGRHKLDNVPMIINSDLTNDLFWWGSEEGVELYQIDSSGKATLVPHHETDIGEGWDPRDQNYKKVTIYPGGDRYLDTDEIKISVYKNNDQLKLKIQEYTPLYRIIYEIVPIIGYSQIIDSISNVPTDTIDYDVDLNLISSDGKKVGMNYQTDIYYHEIESVHTSGNIPSGGYEWISVPRNIDAEAYISLTPELKELIRNDETLNFEVVFNYIIYDENGDRKESLPISMSINSENVDSPLIPSSPINITFLPPITTMDQFNLTDGSTLPIKFTARNSTIDEFIYDDTVNVTITNSTGHQITYFTNGTGTDSVRINSTEEQYIANFHTKDYAINIGETYSVTVTFGEPDSLRGYDITYFTLIEGGKAKGKGN